MDKTRQIILLQWVGGLNRVMHLLLLLLSLIAGALLCLSSTVEAALISGNIFTGQQVDGKPDYHGAPPLYGAGVMVQNQHSGGEFITYGTVEGNSWQAEVPAPGDYVVMFSAPGHAATSREFRVTGGESLSGDAYLPPLPLPAANLLYYAFYDNYTNGEDDAPDDPPLNGVTVTVRDEQGNILATQVTGAQTFTTRDGQLFDKNSGGKSQDGFVYFTNLPPGTVIVASDPSTVYLYDNPKFSFTSTTEYYLTSSEEGGQSWEVTLYPGDPGTEAGGYLIWHGFVEKLGQIGASTNPTPYNSAITGSISGILLDADGNDPAEPFPPNLPNVSPNTIVPEGVLMLVAAGEWGKVHPIATTETDPVSGMFKFENVPPGNYKIFTTDKSIDYVWGQKKVKVAPGMNSPLSIMLPRFYARAQGYVTNSTNGNPIAGARVNMRLKDGSVWKTTLTDLNGWYNFDDLPEVEVMGYVDVEPVLTKNPGKRNRSKYRGERLTQSFDLGAGGATPATDVTYNSNSAYIQWFTFNYQADLQLERIPAEVGDIRGFIFYDQLAPPFWVGDGLYDRLEERTIHGVTVQLYEQDPVSSKWNVLKATTTTGMFNKDDTLAQGWAEPYTWPPDEFGGVFKGPLPGYYEFRDLPPGKYKVKVVTPQGYSRSPSTPVKVGINIVGGISKELNLGLSTIPAGSTFGVPLAGEIEGGVFDDLNVDVDFMSLLFMEKAGISGVPVGVYDHLGYFLGGGHMGNPLCYAGSSLCPPGELLGQKPEMERRFAPGVHIYFGNDPSLEGYNSNYLPLALSYQFGQGKYKFEADWSLVPVAFGGVGGAMLWNGPVIPDNAPMIQKAGAGGSYVIMGRNFGNKRGYSTVTLSGRRLKVKSWSDTEIHVADSPEKDVSGPLTVATSTGISNSVHLDVAYTPSRASEMASRSVFVGPNGEYTSISDALNHLPHLPKDQPRYVFVAPGTYYEQVQITESNLYIIGTGPRETIIDGLPEQLTVTSQGSFNGGGPVFFIGKGGESGNVDNVMISGFTITGGTVQGEMGAGIFGDYGNTNLNINNCIIRNNGGYYGGGIWLHLSNHNVKIWSNIIADNGNFGGYGGGISVNDEPEYGPEHSEPEHIQDDHVSEPPPGTYKIFNNLIFHNFSPDYGGGISLYEIKDHLRIYGNVIMENKSDDHGGGMFFEDTGPIDLHGNIFLRNYCADDGGAISFEDVGDDTAIVKIYNNLFAENIADDRGENHARGGALAFDDTFYVKIYNNTIVGNIVAGSYDPAGGGIDSERNGHEYNGGCPTCPDLAPGFSDPAIYNNIIWDNWVLSYDQPGGEEDDLDYTWGLNYRWTPNQLHVDNPNLQDEWESHVNSESFTTVKYNNIYGGSYGDRKTNYNFDPNFVAPLAFDYRLSAESQLINKAPAQRAPARDLENELRISKDGMVDIGAYEYRTGDGLVIRIPTGILGAVLIP